MRISVLLLFCIFVVCGQTPDVSALAPFPMDWEQAKDTVIDFSDFQEKPAGKDGFIAVLNGRMVKPNGNRFRVWGVNIVGPNSFPSHAEAVKTAEHLARMGVNCVRFHGLDSNWGRSIFDEEQDDTRHLDSENLERLDFFIAELKKRGIYSNLNLNVFRRYKEGDGVRDYKILGLGKSATYFNPRLIFLQKEYAEQLLTHNNQYTGNEYRNEPAILAIELVNENSVLEGWVGWRLVGRDDTDPGTWSPIPVSYARELTELYNQWLKTNLPPDELKKIRDECNNEQGDLIPRLKPDEFKDASKLRFTTEARFYIDIEHCFFQQMRDLLKNKLRVRPLIAGTADHNDSYAAYAHIRANAMFDIIDGHGYWQHPNLDNTTWCKNTPMVNDPFDSTVVQFARTPLQGKPFTISEVNHPFPHEYACEGYTILTAYALFHNWDGIYWFTFGSGEKQKRPRGIRRNGWFDFSNDPVKMANLYTCALMWNRHDIEPAQKTVIRTVMPELEIAALRMERSKERPFFMPGFARSTPLVHKTLFRFGTDSDDEYIDIAPINRIESDTGQLGWYNAGESNGIVTIDSPKTQALIGFVESSDKSTSQMTTQITNNFCSIILTSIDGVPLRQSKKMLLTTTARCTNTGFEWEKDRQTVAEWGQGPALIEAVSGKITLRNIGKFRNITVTPLSPLGIPMDTTARTSIQENSARIWIGNTPTTWYMIKVQR
ncbi:MAG: hypothetical protein K9N52_03605 [Verrucomicrobia bacterium]|nr:hypothetical protein [Verrucomicrobiota bacterium]